jgi:uncharacterized protein YybS (DUF2232 family)
MPRRLSMIEIAEGALLADIAVVLQLLALYLPYFDMLFRLLTPTVFAILVLRRRLYAGIMCLCVTLFIVGVTSGLNLLVLVLLECGAGLFLGVTMKRRLHHAVVLPLGVTGAAITLYALLIFFTLLAGLPLETLSLQLRRSYQIAASLSDAVTAYVGLGAWWRQSAYPAINALVELLLGYWLALLFAGFWLVCWPLVSVVYYVTNVFVRLLGYDVRPFPGERFDRFVRWLLHKLFALVRGRAAGRRSLRR